MDSVQISPQELKAQLRTREQELDEGTQTLIDSLSNDKELTYFANITSEFILTKDGRKNPTAVKYIHAILNNHGSDHFFKEITGSLPLPDRFLRDEVDKVLSDKYFSEVATVMVRNKHKFAYALALLLSTNIGTESADEDLSYIADQLEAYNSTLGELPIEAFKRSRTTQEFWGLCDKSESFMKKAISDTAVLVLTDELGEPLLLTKFAGRCTALTLRAFTTQTGQIVPAGIWLSPDSSSVLRDKIYEAYDGGQKTISLPESPDGNWVLQRDLITEGNQSGADSPEEYLDQVNVSVRQFLDDSTLTKDKIEVAGIGMVDRKQYRKLNTDADDILYQDTSTS